MGKRFTDTERFRDPWYRKLTPVQKCMWEYMLSECNHAGIMNFDVESMAFHIGADIDQKDVDVFKGRIEFLQPDLIFIPKFIKFQYGELNPENKAHKGVIKVLEQFKINPVDLSRGCEAPSKGLEWTLLGPQGIGKGIGVSKNKRGIVKGEKEKPTPKPTLDEVKAYCTERGKGVDPERWYDHYTAVGWRVGKNPMKDWRAAVRNWEGRDYQKPISVPPKESVFERNVRITQEMLAKIELEEQANAG